MNIKTVPAAVKALNAKWVMLLIANVMALS